MKEEDVVLTVKGSVAQKVWYDTIGKEIAHFIATHPVARYPTMIAGKLVAMFVEDLYYYVQVGENPLETYAPKNLYPINGRYNPEFDLNQYYCPLHNLDRGAYTLSYELICPHPRMWMVLFEDGSFTAIWDTPWDAVKDAIDNFDVQCKFDVDSIVRHFAVKEQEAGWPPGWAYDA